MRQNPKQLQEETEVGHQEEITAQYKLAWLFTLYREAVNFNTHTVFTHGNKNTCIFCSQSYRTIL